jgi:hypothetical protein
MAYRIRFTTSLPKHSHGYGVTAQPIALAHCVRNLQYRPKRPKIGSPWIPSIMGNAKRPPVSEELADRVIVSNPHAPFCNNRVAQGARTPPFASWKVAPLIKKPQGARAIDGWAGLPPPTPSACIGPLRHSDAEGW